MKYTIAVSCTVTINVETDELDEAHAIAQSRVDDALQTLINDRTFPGIIRAETWNTEETDE